MHVGEFADKFLPLRVLPPFRFFAQQMNSSRKPISQRVRQSAEERRLVRKLVRSHGDDSLAFFSLRRDKSYFFSPTRRSFLAYKVVGGCALVSGDPVGEKAELPQLLAEFQRVCHTRGWRVAFLNVSDDLLPAVRALGLRAIKIGDEAVVRPATFSLEGRAIRKVRQSVTRLERHQSSGSACGSTPRTPPFPTLIRGDSASFHRVNLSCTSWASRCRSWSTGSRSPNGGRRNQPFPPCCPTVTHA